MSFGHHANEWEGPVPPLCPLCGEHHEPGPCPLDLEEEWDRPEPPYITGGQADIPLWCLGEHPFFTDDDPPSYSYRQVDDRSDN